LEDRLFPSDASELKLSQVITEAGKFILDHRVFYRKVKEGITAPYV
jgi:hypothetical protein